VVSSLYITLYTMRGPIANVKYCHCWSNASKP